MFLSELTVRVTVTAAVLVEVATRVTVVGLEMVVVVTGIVTVRAAKVCVVCWVIVAVRGSTRKRQASVRMASEKRARSAGFTGRPAGAWRRAMRAGAVIVTVLVLRVC